MKIRENIHHVGVIDEKVRIFHGYETPIGTTYNAYLIIDDKITLIDFVKAPFASELLSNIRSVIGDKPIDYFICNHVEPDHSGALPLICGAYPNAVVYGTAACERELAAYYPGCKYQFVKVGAGSTLCTGKYNFKFMPMPMVHWPDSMSTYLEEEGILFSNDALGQHIGTGELLDHEINLGSLLDRAGDYYANIVLPFGMQVSKLLDSVSELDISLVCPSHGVVLEKSIPDMIKKYRDWSGNFVDPTRAVTVYDTMWGTTRKMAARISEEWKVKGVFVEEINLSERHYSYAMSRILEAKYIFVGSPTLNNNMLPTVSAFLTYMKGLKPRGERVGMAFGSYGWSGESVSQVNDVLSSCGFEMLPPIKALWNI